MQPTHFKINYRGSLFWLFFWALFFFPIALVLFFTGYGYTRNGTAYEVHYEGSRFWLCFWTLLCFPIALILFFLTGFTVHVK